MSEATRTALVLVVPGASLASTTAAGVRAMTLADLRAQLRSRFAPALELAEPAAIRLALARVAPEAVAADPWLGPIARRGGRAWIQVLSAIDEAIGALVGGRDALRAVARGHDGAAARAGLLDRVGRALDRALEECGLVDPRREAEVVADLVAHAEPADVVEALAATELRARGIVEWTASDLALWRVLDAALSRASGRAAIELPIFDQPLDAERERDPLERLVEAVAAALDDAPLTRPVASPLGGRDAGLSDVAVDVRRAVSADAQGRAVADAVHEALLAGAAPSQVLIGLMSDEDVAAREILRALSEAGIPTCDCRRERGRGSHLTALAEFAIEVAQRGGAREDVARLLKSSYVDPRALLGHEDEGAGRRALRELSRALTETPTAPGETLRERLPATVAAWCVGRKRNPTPLAQAALRVAQSLGRLADGSTRAEYVRSTRALWRDLGLDRSPSSSSVALSRSAAPSRIDLADLEARARDEGAWDALVEALASYERATTRLGVAAAPAALETFRAELAWVLERHGRDVLPGGVPGAVRVVGYADLPAESAELVVLANADSVSWPEGRARPELLHALLASRLADAGDPALRPLAEVGGAQVLARLALATSRARRVLFTCVVRDEEGGVRAPAPVVRPFVQADAPVWRSTVAVDRPLSARDSLLLTLVRSPERARLLVPDVARRADLDARRARAFGAALVPGDPLIATLPRGEPFTTILTEETGGGVRPLAASSVDGLASCVFRGFVADVLRPRRTREANDVADVRESGQLAHRGVEAAFRATAELWAVRPRDAPAILQRGLAAADRALGRELASSDLARVAIDQARVAVRATIEWSLADDEWDFALAEQPFGEDGAWPPLELSAEGMRVALRGRVDRVDVAHASGRVRVIDYKSKERGAESHTEALGVTKFQIALYGRVAATALGRAAADGLYLGLQRLRPGGAPRRARERWVEAHEPVEGVPAFERRVLDLVGELRRGEIAVRPYEAASCAHCDFDGVCRKPRFAPAAPVDDVETDDGR